jgi:glutaconate CoA-transferase, subunit B
VHPKKENEMTTIADPGTQKYSMAELMVIEIARNMGGCDGKFGGCGAAATLPMAAIRLAKLTVAPSLSWFCGDSSAINPTFDRLPETAAHPRNMVGAEGRNSMMDVLELGLRADWDFGFQGGIQMDKYGNANMIGIGPYDNLKMRGPGSVGTPWSISIGQIFMFFWHHSRMIFVDKIDFLSAPGFLEGGDSRWKVAKPQAKGPTFVFSPICVMDFEETSHAARLRSVNPGYTIDDVVSNTGFKIIIPEHVPMTTEPTDEELSILRTQVDRDGVLKKFRLTFG